MNYRTCVAINRSFHMTDDGNLGCPASKKLVTNSLQKAYIYANIFFYEVTEREINKLRAKINQRRENIINSTGRDPEAVEKIFPNLSAQFKTEVGDNSLDPLIKVELSKIKRNLSLQPTKEELKALDAMFEAICTSEIEKFKRAVITTEPNKGKPYEINFSPKYIANLPPRAKLVLKPTIKMVAYTKGLKFDQFTLTPDYKLTYTWSPDRHHFDEDKLKDEIKSLIAKDE